MNSTASVQASCSLDGAIIGSMAVAGASLVLTIDRGESAARGDSARLGLAAFRRDTLAMEWWHPGFPALASVSGDIIVGYSRAGIVAAVDLKGKERWRTVIPDDRSEPAQLRDDPAAPLAADTVCIESSIFLPAREYVLQLSAKDGALLVQTRCCFVPEAVVARLATTREGMLVAVCTERTEWDHESNQPEPMLWQPSPAPEAHRMAPGSLCMLDRTLAEQWSTRSPLADVVLGHRRPVTLEDGAIAVLAAQVARDGDQRFLRSFRSTLLVFEPDRPELRWWREVDGSYSQPDPTAIPGGVVAGVTPTFFEIGDGSTRWQIDADRQQLDPAISSILAGNELLMAGADSSIRAVSLIDGSVRQLARFSPVAGARVTGPLLLDGGDLFVSYTESGVHRLAVLR